MTSETIMAAYHALYQAVSAESSPYQEELLSALSALESGLQAHIDFVRQPSDGDGPQVWSNATRIMAGSFHPVAGTSDEDTEPAN